MREYGLVIKLVTSVSNVVGSNPDVTLPINWMNRGGMII